MILTRNNLAAYLIERGVISPHSAPEISDVGRTNRVFRVAAEPTALFVKQPQATNALAHESSRREAALYAVAEHDEALRRLTPRLVHREPRYEVLVTEERLGAVDFTSYVRSEGRAPSGFEERLAEALARHHGRPLESFAFRGAGFDPSRCCPVVLALGHAPHETWIRFGPIGPQVGSLLRRRPQLARMFNDTQNDWRSDALIHGDLGFENIVLHPRTAASPFFYFVDWEMACVGDAAWDLATVVRPALTAVMMGHALDVESAGFRNVKPPPQEAAPRWRFWTTYARVRGWDGRRADAELERVTRFAAIQIAWSIVERTRRSPRFDPKAIDAIEAALVVAHDPRPALRAFESN